MPKALYCAQCGKQLAMSRKAVKMQVIDVVEPHQCGEVQDIPLRDTSDIEKVLDSNKPVTTNKEMKSAKAMLDSFPFVQKLNKAKSEVETFALRDSRQGRDEVVSSTEPQSLRDIVMSRTGTVQQSSTEKVFTGDGIEDESEMEG